MNYLLAVWRFSIVSLLLSSLSIGMLPASAATLAPTPQTATRSILTAKDPIELSTTDRFPASETLIAQSVKVTPQLEKQILEVLRRHPDVLLEVLQKYAI